MKQAALRTPTAVLMLLLFFLLSVSSAECNQVSEDRKDLDTRVRILLRDCDTLVASGRLDSAKVLAQLARDETEKEMGKSSATYATALSTLGSIYFLEGDYERFERLNMEALAIRERVFGKDHPAVADNLDNIATLYMYRGRYLDAEPLLERARSIYEKAYGPEHIDVANSLDNLATLYYEKGKYADAEVLHRRALRIKKKTLGSSHPSVAWSESGLAALCVSQGRYDEAEQLFTDAVTIWENALGPEHPLVGFALNNFANFLIGQERLEEAEIHLRRALLIWEKALGSSYQYLIPGLTNLARIYAHQTKFAEAENLYNTVITITEKTLPAEHHLVVNSLNELARLYMDQGKYKEALPLLRKAVLLGRKALGPDHPKLCVVLRNLAIDYCCLGDFTEAFITYRDLQDSRRAFINDVFSYASEDQKLRYLETYPLIDDTFLTFALLDNSQETVESAFDMVLRGKAAVMDAVSVERELALASEDEGIRNKVEIHAQTCSEIATVTLSAVDRLNPETYHNRLKILYARKDSLETELSRVCSAFSDSKEERRFTISDISGALPEKSVLWEFVRYEPYDFGNLDAGSELKSSPRYLAFTLGREGTITLNDLGEAAVIDSLVSEARGMIYDARTIVYSSRILEATERLSKITRKLYEKIFAPLESGLNERDIIFISPDGQLNLLPFDILPASDEGYVTEKYRISYLSSGRDIIRFGRTGSASDRALLIADPDFDLAGDSSGRWKMWAKKHMRTIPAGWKPTRGVSSCLDGEFTPLPCTRDEARSVMETIGRRTGLSIEYYSGEDAREEVLKIVPDPPRILHLATHGYFCEDIPGGGVIENPLLRSGLALAGANNLREQSDGEKFPEEDGILTGLEVSGLNLQGTELATLSACETGMGEVRNGEGVFGLRRAFQLAGVETILMSLWRVPDEETGEIMVQFYESWLGGRNKIEAFHLSVLNLIQRLREKYGTAHPFLWGGFVLLGDPN